MKKRDDPNLQVGDVIEKKTGTDGPQKSHYLYSREGDKNLEWGKWAEVTVVKKIVDNDTESAIYYETARRYIETGKTVMRRSQTKQAKYLCVNGPSKGKYLTAYGEGSDEDYIVYNCGSRFGKKTDAPPSAVLVHTPNLRNGH